MSKQELSPEARQAGRRWAIAIVAGLSVVVVVNFYVVWLVRDRNVTLVTPSYYQDGLAYDAVVDAGVANRAREVRFDANGDGRLSLTVSGRPAEAVAGRLHFYRASDPALDYVTDVDLQASKGEFIVPATSPTVVGPWRVTFVGDVEGQPTRLTTVWTVR